MRAPPGLGVAGPGELRGGWPESHVAHARLPLGLLGRRDAEERVLPGRVDIQVDDHHLTAEPA